MQKFTHYSNVFVIHIRRLHAPHFKSKSFSFLFWFVYYLKFKHFLFISVIIRLYILHLPHQPAAISRLHFENNRRGSIIKPFKLSLFQTNKSYFIMSGNDKQAMENFSNIIHFVLRNFIWNWHVIKPRALK